MSCRNGRLQRPLQREEPLQDVLETLTNLRLENVLLLVANRKAVGGSRSDLLQDEQVKEVKL